MCMFYINNLDAFNKFPRIKMFLKNYFCKLDFYQLQISPYSNGQFVCTFPAKLIALLLSLHQLYFQGHTGKHKN